MRKNRCVIMACLLASLTFFACGVNDNHNQTPDSNINTTTSITTCCTECTTTESVTTSSTTTSCITTNCITTVTTEEVTTVEAQTEIETENNEVAVASETHEDDVQAPEPVPVIEYVVYKPSTHYVHRSSCRWNTNDAYEISDTNGIEARKCTECSPDIEIVNEYVEPVVEYVEPTVGYCNSTDREYLAQIVEHEAGSDWISTYNKACVVAVVMNRVNSSSFPNTVYGVLTQPKQFSGFWFGYSPSQSCYDAVDYYFAHQNEFGNILYFHGDGNQNYFS